MIAPPMPTALVRRSLPLALPEALWVQLTDTERAIYSGAQCIIEGLQRGPEFGEGRLDNVDTDESELVLGALHLLEEMGLVRVQEDGEELGLTLLALPEEHIPVHAPDHSVRWLFVSRPLREPEWGEFDLN